MKPGRNDPCACGSGKKYKHCCLKFGAPQEPSAELIRARYRRAYDGVPDRLARIVNETYGQAAIHEAWREFFVFSLDDDAQYDPNAGHDQLFLPWFFHRWTPDPADTSVEDKALHGYSPSASFLARHGARVDPLLRRYLEACIATPLSFFQILEVMPGRSITVRDVLTGDEFGVSEKSATVTLNVDDLIYAQIVRCGPIAILEGCPTYSLRPLHTIQVIALREEILAKGKRNARSLAELWEWRFRELYLKCLASVLTPLPPQIQNTDGDPLVPIKLVFDIDSPQAALDALQSLAVAGDNESPHIDIERNTTGELQHARFSWLRINASAKQASRNTVLGSIGIDRRRLTCEVNSENRAAAFRRLIEKRPKSTARFRQSEIGSLEREPRAHTPGPALQTSSTPESDFANIPEVRAKINDMMAAHYDTWLTERLPVLDNRSPKQAVRSAAGREKVEVLIRDIERHGRTMNPPLDPAIIRRLREQLRLT